MFVVYQGVAIVAYLACLNIQTVSGQHEGSTERNCKYMKDETIIPSKDPFSVRTTKGIIKCLDKGCHANAKIVSYNTSDSSCSLYDGGAQNGGNRVDGASVYIDVSEEKNNSSWMTTVAPISTTASTSTIDVIDHSSIADVELLPATHNANEAEFGAWNLFDGKGTKEECEASFTGVYALVHSTERVDRPRIVITLNSIQDIIGVKLWNRDMNNHGDRTENMEVRVSLAVDFSDSSTFCDSYPGIMTETIYVFMCQNGYITGQNIRLLIDNNPATLNLYEAELYHV